VIIAGKSVLVTGANRGIGQSIAQNWGSGAAKVLERQYAALAQPQPAT
jgi:NAD(P)-dependent dehydrogenase (short-subunit alcohol dehydrogenase family)